MEQLYESLAGNFNDLNLRDLKDVIDWIRFVKLAYQKMYEIYMQRKGKHFQMSRRTIGKHFKV